MDQLQDLSARMRIQVARGFICQQNRRIHAKRPSDCHPLALAAGEFVRQMIQALAQTDQVQQLSRTFLNFLARPAAQMQRKRHVLQARKSRQQIEELEDEPDLVAANASQIVVAEFRKRLAVQFYFAGARMIQPADQIQHGGFSGSGRTHDGRHLALGDRKIDPVQRRYLTLSVKSLGNTPQQDHAASMMTSRINSTLQS